MQILSGDLRLYQLMALNTMIQVGRTDLLPSRAAEAVSARPSQKLIRARSRPVVVIQLAVPSI